MRKGAITEKRRQREFLDLEPAGSGLPPAARIGVRVLFSPPLSAGLPVTGIGRIERYREYVIDAQAMSVSGGQEHRARVGVRKDHASWRGPFVDYGSVFATEDQVAATESEIPPVPHPAFLRL